MQGPPSNGRWTTGLKLFSLYSVSLQYTHLRRLSDGSIYISHLTGYDT